MDIKKKSLYDISWKVTEEEYRADPALSYTTISRFSREGFGKLKHLFDKLDTPSLTFGSAVDALLTGGEEEFNRRFIVVEFPQISDSIEAIVRQLFDKFSSTYKKFEDIPDDEVSFVAKINGFWSADKWNGRRAKEVRREEGCGEYYDILYRCGDKKVLSTDTYKDVLSTIHAVKNSSATAYYFAPNNPFDNIERLYQLKFKATLGGVNYRCMADLIIIDYEKKQILPVDLKTSSKYEYEFYKSFIEWSYALQARLYFRIIRDNLDRDPYFKDFELLDYKFIVVNKVTRDPLVWNFKETKTIGILDYGNGIIMKDPEEIGKELNYYLKERPRRPIGIHNENDVSSWIKTIK